MFFKFWALFSLKNIVASQLEDDTASYQLQTRLIEPILQPFDQRAIDRI